MRLPARIDVAAFDALHDDPAAWREVMLSLAREQVAGEPVSVRQETAGTVLVARIGSERVLKLYPPFLRDHFEFERAMLERLHGKLAVPTPRLLASGERDGWPFIVMSQLAGEPLEQTWPTMAEVQRIDLLTTLGGLAAEVHSLPVGELAALAPRWPDFIAQQRTRCAGRQQRTGLPAHLLQALPRFIDGPLPEGEPVLLTGEYTPMNLFTHDDQLAAMFDFGDGLVGPREYDWLGPLCFLAAGSAARCAAFMAGYGAPPLDEALRLALLRLLLLHRYSNLSAQIACAGWQRSCSFEELAARIWPIS
jgi:hygromycin-B 7''-O-kinase